jgi:SecD/SecF fusion protein
MQNRSALWIFSILLALACLWQLSYSFFTSRVERTARERAGEQRDSVLAMDPTANADSLFLQFENRFLREHGNEKIYPVFGYTYAECKAKEMNLGLDLKGGMAVTLEVSVPELVVNLADNSKDPAFRGAIDSARKRMASSDQEFITLFGEEFAKADPNARLSAIFHTPEKKDIFPREASNEDILASLRREAAVAVNNTERILRTRIDKFGVAQPSIQKQQISGRIQIELPGVKDKDRVRKVLQSTANLEFWECYDNQEIYPALEKANTQLGLVLSPELVADTSDTTSAVADLSGLQTADELLASADTVSDSMATVEEDPLRRLSADSDSTAEVDTASMQLDFARKNPLFAVLTPAVFAGQDGGYRLVNGSVVGNTRVSDSAQVNKYLRMPAVMLGMPQDVRFLWGAKPVAEGSDVLSLYAVKVPRGDKPKLDGSSITDARQDFDYTGKVEVRMQMDAEGAQTWKVMTGDNVGKSIAIVLDGLVYSAPVVQGEIAGGSSSISMGSGNLNAQIQEADDLATILKAGALPAPARIIDETVVGAGMGEQNVQSGLWSFVIALLAVLLVMVLYYARAGWVADIALLCNVFFLVGTMASIQSTLTLPGIAGIVLTVGMAVDANVLIFERVREELRAGKQLKSAVDLGFKGALSAIIDSNVTTFFTGVVLFIFGSGPIRGFATTLMIGILTSLFTAIFISRLVISWRLDKNKDLAFWTPFSKNIFVGSTVDFMGKRKVFYVISLLLLAVSVGSMATRGFNLGVDFTGGRTYVVTFAEPVDAEEVRNVLTPLVRSEAGRDYTMNVKTYGASNRLKVTTNYLIDDPTLGTDAAVEARVSEGFEQIGGFSIEERRKVDPTISDDIVKGAVTSVLVALLFMFVYIAVRFRNWQYGLGALLSLLHDTIIVLGLYSLLWGVAGFSLEIDEAFIAVILTVIGYSINDTVVVFDRIREYLTEHKREDVVTVFNKAMNLTLGRTLMTGLNVMIVLLIIFFLGSVSIKGFVFGLFAGVVVGTYSSIFVASAVAVDFLKRKEISVSKTLATAN